MTIVVACLDGLDPAYLESVKTPTWNQIADAGTESICEGALPSLTNVNNISIVTGDFPIEHGITGNSYYDTETKEEVYLTDPAALRRPTLLRKRAEAGESVAALVAKEKLRELVSAGCDIVASAEEPPNWLEDAIGPAPDIYSGEASAWILDAGAHLLRIRDLDTLYVSTTDVVPHKHAPGTNAADEWVQSLDKRLIQLYDRSDALLATADHGMNQKTTCVDLNTALAEEGYNAGVLRLIRDRHTYHHQNLGGAAYVYLDENERASVADISWLNEIEGVEAVVPRAIAADRFRLPPDRVGDAVVLGDERTVFGPTESGVHDEVDLRSHGSLHETVVPYVSSTDREIEFNFNAFTALGEP